MTGIMEMKANMEAAGGTPERVLVVEDDALLALSIEDVLRGAGTPKVTVCPTIELAMASIEEARPDAIILDSHLSDRHDGWALAEVVNCLGPRRPRIIFSTAAPEEIPPEIAKLGVIFEKPYDPSMLIDALNAREASGLFSRFRSAFSRPQTH